MKETRTDRDWGTGGVDWRDSSADEEMASAWLRNERLWEGEPSRKGIPTGYDLDLDARVLELVQTDLDPERGWRLLITLIRLAEDERDLKAVAVGPLETFLLNHGDGFRDRIHGAATSDSRFRAAIHRTTAGR